MSDFSEICPLFNTGVFNEVTFPGPMYLSGVLSLVDLLAGTANMDREALSYFTFGRTVVVTEAFIKREVATNTTETTLFLRHKTSGTQALTGTIFGSITLPLTGSAHELGYTWKPFVAFTAKTFTSTDVLALGIASALTVSSGAVALMVRYKEK